MTMIVARMMRPRFLAVAVDLKTFLVLLMLVAGFTATGYAGDDTRALTARMNSLGSLTAEAMASGDFTFIEKALKDLMTNQPQAELAAVYDRQGAAVLQQGADFELPNGFLEQAEILRTDGDSVWIKKEIRFGDRPTGVIVARFPAIVAKQQSSVITPVLIAVSLFLAIGIGVVLLRRRTGAIDVPNAAPKQATEAIDPAEKQARMRERLGLGRVDDVFLDTPLTQDSLLVLGRKARQDSVREALFDEELEILDKVTAGGQLASILSGDMTREMQAYETLTRLIGAGLVEVTDNETRTENSSATTEQHTTRYTHHQPEFQLEERE